ncbi:hypothetical protein MRB53_037675 [Persea americana]|nr:hypothetical protein MRB53_037675 [Persea americana]
MAMLHQSGHDSSPQHKLQLWPACPLCSSGLMARDHCRLNRPMRPLARRRRAGTCKVVACLRVDLQTRAVRILDLLLCVNDIGKAIIDRSKSNASSLLSNAETALCEGVVAAVALLLDGLHSLPDGRKQIPDVLETCVYTPVACELSTSQDRSGYTRVTSADATTLSSRATKATNAIAHYQAVGMTMHQQLATLLLGAPSAESGTGDAKNVVRPALVAFITSSATEALRLSWSKAIVAFAQCVQLARPGNLPPASSLVDAVQRALMDEHHLPVRKNLERALHLLQEA